MEICEASVITENEFYAVKTLGSSSNEEVHNDMYIFHFMKDFDMFYVSLRLKLFRALIYLFNKKLTTLAFPKKWLDKTGATKLFMSTRTVGILHR